MLVMYDVLTDISKRFTAYDKTFRNLSITDTTPEKVEARFSHVDPDYTHSFEHGDE